MVTTPYPDSGADTLSSSPPEWYNGKKETGRDQMTTKDRIPFDTHYNGVTRDYIYEQLLDINHQVARRFDGIRWALCTGRLPGGIERQVRLMTNEQWLRLAEDMGDSVTMNDVPRWLINHFEV